MGEQGIDLAGADRVVGTSAGALVVALLEAGRLGRFHRELTVVARAQKLLAALAPTDDGTEPGEPIVALGHLQRVFGSVFQAPSGAAAGRGKWGRARLGACRFLLDAVRSWVQFGLEPSCQGPWIVAWST